jgi:hypothetical protein
MYNTGPVTKPRDASTADGSSKGKTTTVNLNLTNQSFGINESNASQSRVQTAGHGSIRRILKNAYSMRE